MEPATQPESTISASNCPFCGGEGVVCANADDVDFEFDCVCAGGSEEAVRWLLGKPPQGEDRPI
jgi:hypothetical protein